MRYTWCLFLLMTVSCTAREEDASSITTPDPTVYNFVPADQYTINQIVLYQGKNGAVRHPDESYIGTVWNGFSDPPYASISINPEVNEMEVRQDKLSLKYSIRISGDSIFRKQDENLIAIFADQRHQLKLKKSFYYILKVLPDQGFSFSRMTKLGATVHQDVFHVNTFPDPDYMVAGDEVFWANLSFMYRRAE